MMNLWMTPAITSNAGNCGGPSCSLNDTVLLIDKQDGLTSFDTIREVRKLCGIRKIGHCGTLDRFATGLLVMCTGRATRLANYLVNGEKSYTATVVLGTVTDTGDPEGSIVKTVSVSGISRQDIDHALSGFRGQITQVPPVYSALKIEGRRASDLARQGLDVSLRERTVTVSSLELSGYDPASCRLVLEVRCSKGTYVRSLARDLGEALGTGAYVKELRRTGSGPFSVSDAVTVDELRGYLQGGVVEKPFNIKPARAMDSFSLCVVNRECKKKAANGAVFPREGVISLVIKEEKKFIILDEDENLIAIADIDIDKWHINYDSVVML